MGPNLLMDKSTLQGLGYKQLPYISRYFQHTVTPILLREIISDLAKEDKDKTNQELKEVVSYLAYKTKSAQSHILPEAYSMACGELLGIDSIVPMNGYQVPRQFGIEIVTPNLGKRVFFDEHPMMETLRSWAEGSFSSLELEQAKEIRIEDSSVNLESYYQDLEKDILKPKYQSLEEMVKKLDLGFLTLTTRRQILQVARHFFQNDSGKIGAIMQRWRKMRCPTIEVFSPYARYCYRVYLIYFFGLLCNFISRSKKAKAHLDSQYLLYLPFCRIFSSDDKELIKLVPFFLRNDQKFISKQTLRSDFEAIDKFFTSLNKDQLSEFYLEYGFYPPNLEKSFTNEVWKKYMRPKFPREGELSKPSPEEETRIMKEFKEFRCAIDKLAKNHSNN